MAHPRPFRFGVIAEHVRTRAELETTARAVEAAGFATLLIRDHFVAEPFGDQLAPVAALTWAAAMTRSLRVGSLVVDNDYRHPAVLAKEAATLDVLSGGRFELGIGCGWLKQEYDQVGMPFDDARVRVDRLDEGIQVLKGLFADAPLTFHGRHYTIAALHGFPRPAQRPHPPILIGAGSKRMLQIAGREADIIGILARALPGGTISDAADERSPTALARKIGWIREAAGDRFSHIELSVVATIAVTDDRRAAAEAFAQEQGWDGLPVEEILSMPAVFIGTHDQIAEEMDRRRERFGLSYFVVSDASIGEVAPLVERLAGR